MFSEIFEEAWRLRYGTNPDHSIPEIAPFLRHRSVRQFSSQEVPPEVVNGLVAAAQSAATSSNLQLWSLISVQDSARREQIAQLCDNQNQIRQAAWFFAFLADHYRLRQAATKVGENPAGLDYTEFFIMALIDVALAAERMVCAAESMGLGICYIGALRNNPQGVQELLNLPEGVFGVFGLCLGWPAEGVRAEIKPRLPQPAIWFRETYNPAPDVEEYNRRMAGFYVSQNMRGEATWSMRSGRRVDGEHMTGREVLKEWLTGQGFMRR